MELNDIISSGLLELYATGLASQDEARQVVQWAQQYPEVADELAQIEASLAVYAQAGAVQPGASVKTKVFEKINEGEKAKVVPLNTPTESPVKVVSISPVWKNVAAAAILLLIGSAVLNIVQFNKSNEKDAVMAAQNGIVNGLIAANDSLQQKGNAMVDYVEVARNPNSRSVSVKVANVADSSAKVFWMQDNGNVYVDPSNLPALPQDKQYELWAIVDGAPVNAGIIITTKEGRTYNVQPMKGFGQVKVQAFAVSIEPKSAKPAEKPTVVYAVGPTI